MNFNSLNPQAVIITALSMFLFGVAYNALVSLAKRSQRLRGYSSLAVVGGVVVVLCAAVPTAGLYGVALIGFYFCFAGLPMIVGDWWRSHESDTDVLDRQLGIDTLNRVELRALIREIVQEADRAEG